jgi:uncharacterized membrane protein
MSGTPQPLNVEDRMAALEQSSADAVWTLREELEELLERIDRLEAASPASLRVEAGSGTRPERRVSAVQSEPRLDSPRARVARHASRASTSVSAGQSLSDLIGGRVLAWVGGVSTLVGTVLFLALAVARGWIGQEARVLTAAAASSALLGVGVWLHDRRGRTEASAAMVGAASAAMFATLVVATQVYGLLPVALALPATLAVGALTTALAVRWAGRAVGGIGLLGGLLSPVLVGASPSALTVAVLGLTAACVTWCVVRTGWGWLGVAGVVACVPQWGAWLLSGQAAASDLVVLAFFAALGLAGAIGVQARSGQQHLCAPAAVLATLSALSAALIGRVGLGEVAGGQMADAWLAVLAIAHLWTATALLRRRALALPLGRLLIVIGVVVADVALALSAGGLPLVVVWSAAAAGFAWLARRTASGGSDEALVGIGLGAHLALALVRALLAVPPGALGAGDQQLLPLLSVCVLAASCLGSAHLLGTTRPAWRSTLNGLGLATLAYVTAASLSGPALVCAWALEALALTRIARDSGDVAARYGGFGFLGLAGLHALIAEAPPDALVVGVPDLAGASLSLGVIAAAMLGMGRLYARATRERAYVLAGSAATSVLLVSVALISAFQPSTGGASETLLDLGVRQQGQLLLSIVWSVVGLAVLIVGLKRRLPMLRSAALVWLMVTVAKVFLYDLSTLTSLYRVASFIVLGLLLLAGAFAYQRLRPPLAADMRAVHPSRSPTRLRDASR